MAAPTLPRSVRRLQAWIADQGLGPGEALPTEQELAAAIGCSQPTIHRACKQLEDLGELERAGRTRLVAGREAPVARHGLAGTALLVARQPVVRPDADGGWLGMWDAIGQATTSALHAAGRPVLSLPLVDTRAHLERCIEQGAPGLILQAADLPDALVEDLLAACADRIPVVCYDDPERRDGLDVVAADQAGGCELLVAHLAGRGCRRIQPLWQGGHGPLAWWFSRRETGYRRACAAAGIAPREPVVVEQLGIDRPPAESFEVNVRLMTGYLAPLLESAEPPDALLAPTDGAVPAVHRALRLLGRELPVAGFDAYWSRVPERRWEPKRPVASVDKDHVAIGQALAAVLQRRISGTAGPEPIHELVPARLALPGRHPALS